jgi:hypothetical protein
VLQTSLLSGTACRSLKHAATMLCWSWVGHRESERESERALIEGLLFWGAGSEHRGEQQPCC